MTTVFIIDMFPKTSKEEIFLFGWKMPKSYYSEYVSRNLFLGTGVLSMHLPFVDSGGSEYCFCDGMVLLSQNFLMSQTSHLSG